MTPAEWAVVSERSLTRALDEFTQAQRRAVVSIGNRPGDDFARALVWRIALRRVVRKSSNVPPVVSRTHIAEVEALLAEDQTQSEAVRTAAEADPSEDNENMLADLLRIVWFDRLWSRVTAWPAEERAALTESARAQMPSLRIAELLRVPGTADRDTT
jgi:hypothetical protein